MDDSTRDDGKETMADGEPMHHRDALPTGVLLRPLRPDDGALLEAFFEALGLQSRHWFHPHPFDHQTAELLASRANDRDTIRYLMIRDPRGRQEVVGYGFLMELGAEMPILGIAIADHAQGAGLGQRLMHHLIDDARHRGKRGIRLTVYEDNDGARHVYEKCGFVTRRIMHHMDLVFEEAP
jgi:ribosomal protein S18 acetylase RimI-like enzyme